MILTKQLDLASSGSSITTPRINLVKELEKYNRQNQEMSKKANVAETSADMEFSPTDVNKEKTANQPPVRSVSRPNILSRRSRQRPQQRSSSLDSVSSLTPTTPVSSSAASSSSGSASKSSLASLNTLLPKLTSFMEKSAMKTDPDLAKASQEVRFFKGDDTPMCAAAVLTIPNPSFLGKSSVNETSKSSSVASQASVTKTSNVLSSSESVETSTKSVKSTKPVYSSACSSTNLETSKVLTTAKVLPSQLTTVSNSNTMVIGNVLKKPVVTDPTTLPVLMPVASDKAFPASPDDVVLPAGKGYVVFKPMGNLPKDCVYSVESSTGLINAIVDPTKFVKQVSSVSNTVSSTGAVYTSASSDGKNKPMISSPVGKEAMVSAVSCEPAKADNKSVKLPYQAVGVSRTKRHPQSLKKPVLNPAVLSLLKSRIQSANVQGGATTIQVETPQSRVSVSTTENSNSFTVFNHTRLQSGATKSLVNEGVKSESMQDLGLPIRVLGYTTPPNSTTANYVLPSVSTTTSPGNSCFSSSTPVVSAQAVVAGSPFVQSPTLKKIFMDPAENFKQEHMTLNQLVLHSKTVRSQTSSSLGTILEAEGTNDTDINVADADPNAVAVDTAVGSVVIPKLSDLLSKQTKNIDQGSQVPDKGKSTQILTKTQVYKVFPGIPKASTVHINLGSYVDHSAKK